MVTIWQISIVRDFIVLVFFYTILPSSTTTTFSIGLLGFILMVEVESFTA
jgi:hypothetical protein